MSLKSGGRVMLNWQTWRTARFMKDKIDHIESGELGRAGEGEFGQGLHQWHSRTAAVLVLAP